MTTQTCLLRLLVVLVTALAGIPLPASASTAQPANEVTITIDNFSFSPATVEIAAGTTVRWLNLDDVPHVIASTVKKQFVSPALDTDDTFSFTFTDRGTFAYYCAMHPHMTGKIIVK